MTATFDRVGPGSSDDDSGAAELERLVEEHGALHRAAALVSRGVDLDRVCQLVTEEACRLVRAPSAAMLRFDEDDRGTIVGRWASLDPGGFPTGATVRLDGDTAVTRVRRTGRPSRVEGYSERGGEIAGIMRQVGFRGLWPRRSPSPESHGG